MPKVIACGGRDEAYRKFCTAVGNASDGEFIVLLVDSEGPVGGAPAWDHLRNRDRWQRPEGADGDNAHLMAQIMESWFLADREALGEYFGNGFLEAALPRHVVVEEIAKADVLNGLKNATRRCRTKTTYDKGQHSFDILARLDTAKVEERAPHARRLLSTIRRAV
jgi:hypothetical protein